MSLLLVDDLKKHYGAQDVLRGVTFQIDPGQKVGLVGRNGGGKSTLLRLIEGLEQPDGGSLTLRKGARLGHVPQIPRFEAGVTVRAHVESGLAEARTVAQQIEAMTERMHHVHGDELDRLIHDHERLTHRLEELGGWDLAHVVERVLTGIGLPEPFWERQASTLSGGERSRTALARELVAGHDLLLLDEPTNHLDLVGIEWIEAWLRELAGAVLIVSHDRRLLSNSVDAILDLERGQVKSYPGNYTRYVDLKHERFASELRAWEIQQDFLSKEQDFIRKHMGSQRTAEAKGRQKKLENLVRLQRPYDDVRRPNIPPPKVDRGGDMVLETRGLAGGYGAKVLFDKLDLRIGRGQRIGVVGPNGAGKTTLLKILAGHAAPLAGSIEFGHKALCGFYDQDTSSLRVDGTPMSELRRERPELTDLEVRSYLARFLFRGEQVEKSVSALSGGERARLCLAKLLSKNLTWLAMDEPTNHLDLAARTSLEELLGDFDGALVTVSHDREFLDGLCTHILEVGGGKARLFTGNYSDWRAQKVAESNERAEQREDAKVAAKKLEKQVAAAAQNKAQNKTQNRSQDKSPAKSQPKTQSKPAPAGKIRNRWAFEKLEQRIIELEAERTQLHAEVVTEEVYRNAAVLRDKQMRIAEVEMELERSNEEWMNWS